MADAADAYVHCDELDQLPKLHKENWLFELDMLAKSLEPGSTVLQVGCMDGTRIMRLLELRPDLRITGLDIDAALLRIAEKNFHDHGLSVRIVLADITHAKELPQETYDYVLCLNNTLGYIEDDASAIANMRALGRKTMISVYGEAFDDARAAAYFATLGLRLGSVKGNVLRIADFGKVRRFTRKDIEQWGGRILETPLGYCSILEPTQ